MSRFYVHIPLIGNVSFEVFSVFILFISMVIGMMMRSLFDLSAGGTLKHAWLKVIRPLFVSPIVFSAFIGLLLAQGQIVAGLQSILFAFQIGFMWQQMLEKKTQEVLEPRKP